MELLTTLILGSSLNDLDSWPEFVRDDFNQRMSIKMFKVQGTGKYLIY